VRFRTLRDTKSAEIC